MGADVVGGPLWSHPPGSSSSGSGDFVGPASSTDNAIVRFDSTTGKLGQNSIVGIADADALATPAVYLLTDPNTGVSWVAGADKVSLVAGGIEAIRANTVASGVNYLSVTPGAANTGPTLAAAGTGSNLALFLLPTGTGAIAMWGATSSFPGFKQRATSAQVQMSDATGASRTTLWAAAIGIGGTIDNYTANDVYIAQGSSAGVIGIRANSWIGWVSGSDASQSHDTNLCRIAAGVVGVGTGSASSRAGWTQWAGEAYLAANDTNATATMASTGLSVNVTTGRKYGFKCVLYVNDSVAAEGAKFDFDGGSATATNFRVHGTLFDAALNLSAQASALATDFASATVTGDAMAEFHGTFEPSSTGTFIPRFAQNSHAAGTLTIYRGSHILMWDLP